MKEFGGLIMSIPSYHEFYRAVLEVLADGQVHGTAEIVQHCVAYYHLSQEDCNQLLPSGGNKLNNLLVGLELI